MIGYDVEEDFAKVKNEIKKAILEMDYYKAVCISKYICNSYYELNYKYMDDEIEDDVETISNRFLGKIDLDEPCYKKVLFYDYFGLANRGLACVYIDGLLNLNYKVIWVLFDNAPELEELRKRYNHSRSIRFRIISKKNLKIMDRIIALSRIIKEEAPRFLFFYSHPADIEGAIVFGAINGDVNRYLIDLTDHAYWIGKKSCDKFIEFRELGANIAVKERGVKAEKIRLLPFYPEDRNNIAFEGMPFSEDKDFFFSGGSSYKINGSDEYEKIVCSILSKYTKLNFVYAHEKNIDKNNKLFDIKNKFPGRVYLISERRDLDQILKRAKFYLSTYPIGGGLMCMYAIKNECYPLTLCNDIFITNPKSFLLNPDKIDFCFDNRKNLLDKVDELMCQEKKIYDYSDLIITKSSFNRQLNDILNEHKVSIGFRDIDIFDDCTKLRKLYMDSFDDSKYRELIVNSRNKWVMELLKNRI